MSLRRTNRILSSRITATVTALALFSSVGGPGVGAAEKQVVPVKGSSAQPPASTDEFHTSRHITVRRVDGDLTLERAVQIALSQNPQLLQAIQEIERTRGQIIEVRAAALPQITTTGIYQQQDRRLIRGGGGGFGSTGGNNAAGGALAASSIAQTNAAGLGTNSGTSTAGLTTQGNSTVGSSNRTTAATVVSGAGAGSSDGSSSGDSAASSEQLAQALSSLFATQDQPNTYIQNKSWNVQIQVRQALYAGGQIRAAIHIAQLANDSAYYSLRDVIDGVVAVTRQQFYNVLLTRALILVQEESVRLLEQQRQDQQNRFEAGTVPRFNVLQAEVALSNARPDLIRARNNYLLAQIQLARTLNLEPGPAGKATFNCVGALNASLRPFNLEDSLLLARARRPYLKVQRQAILIDVENITVEMAGYKPRVDGQAGWQFRNRAGAEDLSDVVNGWFFGVTGSWDIFDGFATYGRVKQARARLDQSKINYIDAVHQVDQEVETAFVNLQQARETIASQQKNIEQAEEAVRLAQERLSAGAGTQLEVLDARVQLTRARSTELQARADYNNALADYDRATGTNTVYHEEFKDPLEKVQKGIFARLAETGLPKTDLKALESGMPANSVRAATTEKARKR